MAMQQSASFLPQRKMKMKAAAGARTARLVSSARPFGLAANGARALRSRYPRRTARGRGECRALASPMARLRKKCRRQVPQVRPKTPNNPRAMVLTLIRGLLGAPGFLATVARDGA